MADPPLTRWTAHLRSDLPASVVVFLVALPLCLGIALASGAPLVSGLVAGVVGGIVVGAVSRSALLVSGPAAGLTAIVLAAIAELGSFDAFLVAVVLAGLLQIGLGWMRAGFIGDFFPTSVIRGMLAAIGLILVLKQLPHLFGYDHEAMGDERFERPDGETTFDALATMLDRFEAGAVLIGVVSLVLLLVWERLPSSHGKLVPGPLVAVAVGVAMNEAFVHWAPALALGTAHLVQLPTGASPAVLIDELTFPRWSAIADPVVLRYAVTIALVASLESLLSLEAVGKLDPAKRRSDPDRELLAQGIGNTLSGLAGGLPITGVIVRSAANVSSGAKTRVSAMLHGVWLLFAVALLPALLNRIPLAALAAVLVVVGGKLAHPAQLMSAWRTGIDYFLPFVVTIAAILFSDLLVGIGIGLATGAFFILREHARSPGLVPVGPPGSVVRRYALGPHVTFLARPRIARSLAALPSHSRVEIDARGATRIDPDVLSLLREFEDTARERHIDYRLVGVPDTSRAASAAH